MSRKRLLQLLMLIVLLVMVGLSSPATAASFQLSALDPNVDTTLGSNEPLYIKLDYNSESPVRFLASAVRNGEKREVGAVFSSATLHAAGEGSALVWIAFVNPTHIDKVVVTAYDGAWQRIDSASGQTDVHWSGIPVETPRKPSAWVDELQKKERLKLDYMFDPAPKRPEPVSDIIFVLALLSIPTYIFLQVQMLRRYHKRWREMATVPLITALPMVVYALWVGIGFNVRLWPPFIMYFLLAACFYLLTLWSIKKIRS